MALFVYRKLNYSSIAQLMCSSYQVGFRSLLQKSGLDEKFMLNPQLFNMSRKALRSVNIPNKKDCHF
jgi:hypothetical protein